MNHLNYFNGSNICNLTGLNITACQQNGSERYILSHKSKIYNRKGAKPILQALI